MSTATIITPPNNNGAASDAVQVIDFSTVSNLKPLHPLGATVRRFIYQEIQAAARNPRIEAVVLTGGTANFSTGADVTEFAGWIQNLQQQPKDSSTDSITGTATALPEEWSPSTSSSNEAPPLNALIKTIEECPKPVVAAMAGMALGGGLELCLACHYRVACNNKRLNLGLPECKIGLIPGAGGTQRLPRLIGLTQACPLILTGKSITSGAVALKLGLADALVDNPKELIARASQWALWAASMAQASSNGPQEFLKSRLVGQRAVPEDAATVHNILHVAQLSLPPAGPSDDDKDDDGRLVVMHACLRALRASATLPLTEGLAVEAECFLEALTSPAGMAQRHLFFATRRAQKPRADAGAVDIKNHFLLKKSKKPVQTAVIGAGTMGCGIAMVLLKAGFAVTLVDVSPAALAKGVKLIHATITKKKKKGQSNNSEGAAALFERLDSTTNLEDLSSCLLVVEAVVEKLQIKQKIFSTLARVTPPHAILLSNTSTLDIDAMASALPSPQRRAQFAGWHFFSPAHVMKLLEIVVGKDTSPTTVSLLQALSKKVGKIAVVVGNCDGFCGNRLLRPYSLEMVAVLTEGGASIAEIDDAIHNHLGMALGPFAMADLAGNDVGYNIRVERGWAVRPSNKNNAVVVPSNNRPARYSELADVMVTEYGRLGQKVGKGWYDYDPTIGKGRTPLPSAEMQALVQQYTTQHHPNSGNNCRRLSPQGIIERIIFPLVNEGFKCLEEGIVQRPSDIDVVYVYGYGWGPWRGGPMYWADHDIGLPRLLHVLQGLSRQFPDTPHYEPSRLLQDCVERGLMVEEYYAKGLDGKQAAAQRVPSARL